jgi:hypothetical protein
MLYPRSVEVVEVGPRDGLQNEPNSASKQELFLPAYRNVQRDSQRPISLSRLVSIPGLP